MGLTKIDDRGLKTPIDLLDNEKIRLGTGNDLEVFHDGSHSYIKDTGTGRLILQSSQLCLQSTTGENLLVGNPDGATELYHDNSKKLETTSTGTTVTGVLRTNSGGGNIDVGSHLDMGDGQKLRLGASDDLQIYHDSSTPQNIINSYTSNPLTIMSNGDTSIKSNNGDNMGVFKKDGAVELYYDNGKTFETVSGGNKFYGYLFGTDDDKIYLGASNDLQIYHDGSNSQVLNSTGSLFIKSSNQVYIQDDQSRKMITCIDGGAVELYHGGVDTARLQTTSSGVEIHNDLLLDGSAHLGNYIRTNYDGGGHMYFKNNSQGANYSSHFQTYASSDEGGTTQTHLHYYHGGYAELLHQGNSSVRTKSGGGVEFQNGTTKIGTYSTNGLAFGADTAAANSIHDYEYGSWTPVYAATGGVYGTLTYTVQTGQYVKIGRMVFVQFYINYTFGSVGGNFRVGGLPYSANSYGAGAVMIGNHALDASKSYVLHTSNDSYLYLYGTQHNTAWASAGADASATIIGSCTYYTTS